MAAQSSVCCWRAFACNQHLEVRACVQYEAAWAPCFAREYARDPTIKIVYSRGSKPKVIEPILAAIST